MSASTLRRVALACAAAALSVFASAALHAAGETPAELEKQRAEQEAVCRRNNVTATFNDCACVARKAVELASAPGETRPVTSHVRAALDACPQQDRPVIANHIFQACHSYMVTVRTDHESFCKCTADGFVSRFYAGTPQVNMTWREKLRREAMQACGLGDQSKRIVTTTPVPAAEAASGCVKFHANEKRILRNAEHNKRYKSEVSTSPDVVLVNKCSNKIELISHVEYTVPRKDAAPACVSKLIFPDDHVEVRSQSRVVRSGLDPRIPAVPQFLCLGYVSDPAKHPIKSECQCNAAFPRVEIPLGETLQPLP